MLAFCTIRDLGQAAPLGLDTLGVAICRAPAPVGTRDQADNPRRLPATASRSGRPQRTQSDELRPTIVAPRDDMRGASTDRGPDLGSPHRMPSHRGAWVVTIAHPVSQRARPVDQFIEIGLSHVGHMPVLD